MAERVEKRVKPSIKITSVDAGELPYIEKWQGTVFSITFKDPRKKKTSNTYCVGFRFLGNSRGELLDPALWQYDHTNYWDNDQGVPGYEDAPVERDAVAQVLGKYGLSLDWLRDENARRLSEYRAPENNE